MPSVLHHMGSLQLIRRLGVSAMSQFQPSKSAYPSVSSFLRHSPSQACRPTRIKLDPDGPVPIRGIVASELLWGVRYKCSKCYGTPKSAAEKPSLREFSTITQEALSSLPPHIRKSFELYVCAPPAAESECESMDTMASLASSLPGDDHAQTSHTQTKIRLSPE